MSTNGNPDCHVILRGGKSGPNFAAREVQRATNEVAAAGLDPRLMVDCSHANSGKDASRQPSVVRDVAQQIASGSPEIFGVMFESFLVAGRQSVGANAPLVYGQSITDPCLDWESTGPLLRELAVAVRARRHAQVPADQTG